MNLNPWIAGPIVACVALPLFFGFLLTVVAWAGGWSALAKAYRTSEPMPYPRLFMQSAELRSFCGYGNCLTLAADADAMYLAVVWPFGFGHPKLKLPWSEAAATPSTGWFGRQLTTFTFERVPSVSIRFKRATAERLVAMAAEPRGATQENSNGRRDES